jgi:hypothetical protein
MDQHNNLSNFLGSVYQAQGIVETFVFGAFVIAKDGVVVSVSSVFFELIEYDESELYGIHALQLITPDEVGAMKTGFTDDNCAPYELKLLQKID